MKMLKMSLVRAILVLIGCCVQTSNPALILDKKFGVQGIADTFQPKIVKKLVVQPDQKIIALLTLEGNDEYPKSTLLRRYNADGSNDATFNTRETIQTLDFSEVDFQLLPDGTIVTVHFRPEQLIVSCYDQRGSAITDLAVLPDWLKTWVEGNNIVPEGMEDGIFLKGFVFQPEGDMIVCGRAQATPVHSTSVLIRYFPTREVDLNFGTDSVGGATINYLSKDFTGITLKPDSSFLVTDGKTFWGYDAHGRDDENFGFLGCAQKRADNLITALALEKDGKIIVGQKSTPFLSLNRYLPNGVLDKTFGIDGTGFTKKETVYGSLFSSVAVQPDGKIVVIEDQGQLQILTRYKQESIAEIEAKILATEVENLMLVEFGEELCAICGEEKEIHDLYKTSCGHFFCREELARWRNSGEENANTCPLCRTPLNKEENPL